MAYPTLYPPQRNSPPDYLSAGITEAATTITVDDGTILPPAPNLLVIGSPNIDAEIVLMIDNNGTSINVQRGQEGSTARAWPAGTAIARNFTSADLAAIQTWLNMMVAEKGQPNGIPTTDANNNLAAVHAKNLASIAAELIANRIYPGVDLTAAFAAEIGGYSDVWAWIKARIQAANFAGIHVGDYIPFVAGGNNINAEIAGMDTYYKYGDTVALHHIDFISRDCWPDAHAFNKVNYNNGTTVSPSPWLAADIYAWLNSLQMSVPNATTANPALIAVDYRTTGVYDKLPAALKAVIVQKRLLLPSRHTVGSLLTADNTWAWADAGKLWLPSEVEVYGCEHWGGKNGYSGGGYQQYPIFSTNMKRVKGAGDGGDRSHWWLSTAVGGDSTNCAYVTNGGGANNNSASTTSIRAPLCFRIS